MSFIASAKVEYGWARKVAALDYQDYAAFRARIRHPEMLKALPDRGFNAEKAEAAFHSWTDMLVNGDEAQAWTDIGVEITMSRVKGLASDEKDIRNTIYQISVANIGLMQIQRAEVLEDCCTNELQSWLDKGWRILAVCPPNDTRRPSYVMGHFEKEA